MPTTYVIHYDTSTGRYFAQNVQTAQIEDLAVTSAKLAAAVVASIEAGVTDGGITSAKLASGIVGSVHLADEAVKSGDIAANIIATPHILAGGILSGAIGADEIGKEHIKDGEIVSAAIGAGIIADVLLANYGVVSGKVASGAITENELVSGISIDIAEMSIEPSYRAEDLISAHLGVQFSTSGYFDFSQAADINSMPAAGITLANILSGQVGSFQHRGRVKNSAWSFSGYVGKAVYAGLSSEVTLTAPSASGQCVQRIGHVIDDDSVFLTPDPFFVQLGA